MCGEQSGLSAKYFRLSLPFPCSCEVTKGSARRRQLLKANALTKTLQDLSRERLFVVHRGGSPRNWEMAPNYSFRLFKLFFTIGQCAQLCFYFRLCQTLLEFSRRALREKWWIFESDSFFFFFLCFTIFENSRQIHVEEWSKDYSRRTTRGSIRAPLRLHFLTVFDWFIGYFISDLARLRSLRDAVKKKKAFLRVASTRIALKRQERIWRT